MRFVAVFAVIVVGACQFRSANAGEPVFKKIQLSDEFYAEGAYFGDFNRDGKLDVVAGPFWYEGLDFQNRHEYRPAQEYDPKNYSDNFNTFVDDFNGDGWPDILVLGMPGEDTFWYENPQGREGHWPRYAAAKNVGNESPIWGDVNGDGRPELIYNIDGYLGYASWDPTKPAELWKFTAITPQRGYHKFTHGVGLGDINGDGRVDIVESEGWWEQPEATEPGRPWILHPMKFADAGAQMLVFDIDGDGLADVITTWHCHEYGLLWYKQICDEQSRINWQRHEILTPKPDVNSSDLRISQMHAFDLADINGDGLPDFITGKRFWAHGPQGDPEPNAPAVLYWFELCRDQQDGAHFMPHLIDDDSGVGTQVAAVDLKGDGVFDIIVSNKKGTFLHLSQRGK